MTDQRCPYCDQVIPERDRAAHDAGTDRDRLDCPHQDLTAIAKAVRTPPVVNIAAVQW